MEQGDEGVGAASVLDDTWRFDLYTRYPLAKDGGDFDA